MMKPLPSAKKTLFAQASILKRLIAFIIDLLIIDVIILFPFRNVFEKIVPETDSFSAVFEFIGNNATASSAITMLTFVIALISILYFAILEKKLGQSIGKMILKLHVKSLNKELRYWQVFVRSLFLIPVFPFMLLWFIDPVVMFFTKENQRLSEILSRTKVVEKYKI